MSSESMPPPGFAPLPDGETLELAWPTGRRDLFTSPRLYAAATRVNPQYGLPGWTRDCGRRFHRGLDIAPRGARPEGGCVTVRFSDCAAGTEYDSAEPAWIPVDEAFAVAGGVVAVAEADGAASDFGCHVILEHRWPVSGRPFRTLYGHLARVDVDAAARVGAGTRLGPLGRTARSEDARNWLAVAPHLHFEARDEAGRPYDPLEFLRRFLPR